MNRRPRLGILDHIKRLEEIAKAKAKKDAEERKKKFAAIHGPPVAPTIYKRPGEPFWVMQLEPTEKGTYKVLTIDWGRGRAPKAKKGFLPHNAISRLKEDSEPPTEVRDEFYHKLREDT